jgi:deoxyribonuclease V
MRPVLSHSWSLTATRAASLQGELAGLVSCRPRLDLRRASLVVGTDVSYSRATQTCYGAAVVWHLRLGSVVEEATAVQPVRFPYVPGLLSFREIPVLVAALRQLRVEPHLVLAEGHGLAHPRRFGLASHLGVLYDRPTVGCAKSLLVGQFSDPAPGRGAYSALKHQGRTVGSVLRTRDDIRPVLVSIGHAVSLMQARRLVLSLTGRHRLPEVLRRAHQLAGDLRREHEA